MLLLKPRGNLPLFLLVNVAFAIEIFDILPFDQPAGGQGFLKTFDIGGITSPNSYTDFVDLIGCRVGSGKCPQKNEGPKHHGARHFMHRFLRVSIGIEPFEYSGT